MSVQLMVLGELSNQPPITGLLCQLNGLVEGHQLSQDGIDEPHGEWLDGRAAVIGGGGK